ncbi:MAG: 1,4-dihydroxy-2-naphthoate octaprenyltransferase [Solirubrobacteraceae bacterium]
MSYWIKAARLRTIPLSISGIIMGSFLAFPLIRFNWLVFLLAILVASLLQILSNFANDYGDGIKGTDNHRKGEARMIASGFILPKNMLKAMLFISLLAIILGLSLLWEAFGKENFMLLVILLVVGGLAILSAIYYTVGKNAYGYKGWGDFFVFLFFGLVSVLGSYTLQVKNFSLALFLPAISIGLLSVAVLNLNNLRDYETDRLVNKNTVVVLLGLRKSKIYQTLLVLLPFLFMLCYLLINNKANAINFGYLVLLLPILIHLNKVWKTKDTSLLDGELKKIGIITFLFALIFSAPFLL